ncbi:SDR family oxidoreductase, partial [Streptomyces sp. SID10244]|nr:SDR family oxidoreductase [Streptomyces sp. SID10244]
GGGSVVTVGSVNAFLPDPGVIDYSAVKAAVTNLCKSLSKEYGAQNIRVNTISPGPVATSLWLGKDGVAESIARAAGGSADDVAQHAAA